MYIGRYYYENRKEDFTDIQGSLGNNRKEELKRNNELVEDEK